MSKNTRQITNSLIALICTSLFLAACVSNPQPLTDRNSQLTQGNVQLSIQVGTTTKVEVLEMVPNITTRSGKEVWIIKEAHVAQSSPNAIGLSTTVEKAPALVLNRPQE